MGTASGRYELDDEGLLIRVDLWKMPLRVLRSGFFLGRFMREIEFTVPEPYDGIPLRSFLRHCVGLSAGLTAKLKRVPGGITRGGRQITAPERLRAGEKIRLAFPDDEKLPRSSPLPITVVYRDEDLLVVEKAAGMPMYPCPGHDADSLANAVAFLQQSGGERYAYRPVYRLDRDTTGLVLLAKNPYAASRLSGKVRKTYLAVCEGKLAGSGVFCGPIGLKPGHTIQRAVVPGGKPAETRWRCVAAGGGYSLVAVHLRTGRTHQIRVHFSGCGHPLAGDDMYGGSRTAIDRQALHCAEIRFLHPVSGKRMRFCSPLPEDMLPLWKSTRNNSINNE